MRNLLLIGLILILSACQQTSMLKPKELVDDWIIDTTIVPTNRQCFTTLTKQHTKNTVFMLAAGANTGELTETTNDVETFSQTMQQHFNIPPNQICKLTNVFKAELENALHSLKQQVINGDKVIIYFSGHGGHIQDNNGDEKDGWDEALITYDIKGKDDDNVKESDVLRDDHFIAQVNKLTTAKVLTVMDTCFSSDMYLG
ncbi:caspase family protein [Candidatus Halobeggiatoa sp. HSG11]|nr:caspase family protein [Candidatus Halobeggiatoa sp. HSG11]